METVGDVTTTVAGEGQVTQGHVATSGATSTTTTTPPPPPTETLATSTDEQAAVSAIVGAYHDDSPPSWVDATVKSSPDFPTLVRIPGTDTEVPIAAYLSGLHSLMDEQPVFAAHCHEALHALGHAMYSSQRSDGGSADQHRRRSSDSKVLQNLRYLYNLAELSRGPTRLLNCNGGLLHGLQESALKDGATVGDVAGGLCDPLNSISDTHNSFIVRFECYHGVGHGFFKHHLGTATSSEAWKDALSLTLDSCRKELYTDRGKASACTNGAWMEYFSYGPLPSPPTPTVLGAALDSMCVHGSADFGDCCLYGPIMAFRANGPLGPGAALTMCEHHVPKHMRDCCLHGAGSETQKRIPFDEPAVADWCTNSTVSSSHAERCFRSALGYEDLNSRGIFKPHVCAEIRQKNLKEVCVDKVGKKGL